MTSPPNLNQLLCDIEVSIYGGPRAKKPRDRTWYWNVLVPPEWRVVIPHRHRLEAGGRYWYEGTAKAKDAAYQKCYAVVGLILGNLLYRWERDG